MNRLLPTICAVLCLFLPCLLSVGAYGSVSGNTLYEPEGTGYRNGVPDMPVLSAEAEAVFEKILSGKITSENGEPLPGVSVLVKGTTIGVSTDVDGTFTLSVPDDAEFLVISYIGYTTEEVPIGNRTVFNISLTPDLRTLAEVVVVGYGVQKRSDYTGSITSVKSEDLTQMPTQRVDQALQGRASGVFILNQSGQPGGPTTIRIRGLNSITGSNQPLIVIDGLQGGSLESLNPNDIESMEILKDASATAIYGSQGANGVILITTRKGKKGKPVINYSYSLGFNQLSKKLDVMSAHDFVTTMNAYQRTRDVSGTDIITPTPIFSPEDSIYWATHSGTDWQDEVYRTAPMQNHQLSIGGGSDNVNYFVSAGYLDHKGILINSGYERLALRANLNIDVSESVKFGLNWAGMREKGNTPPFGEGTADIDPTGQVIAVAPRWDPTIPVYDEKGNYSRHPSNYEDASTWNPVASAKEAFVENNSIRNNINAFLDFKVLDGLSLNITGGAITRNQHNLRYMNRKTKVGYQNNGSGFIQDGMYTRFQNSNILTYDKVLNEKHHLTITGVYEQQIERNKGSRAEASNFLSDDSGISNLGAASMRPSSSFDTKRVISSYLARVNYVLNEKYLLTVSYRIDGSSVFGANNKYGYFPSGSIAWRASEEGFIESLGLFSELKIRASWGVTGNQTIAPYQTLASLSAGGDFTYPYDGESSTQVGFSLVRPDNPNLKWESTTKKDVGIDFGVFNGRLTGTFDYYVNDTKDLLLARQVPAYSGYLTMIDNVGATQTQGWEIQLNGHPLTGTVKWETGLNLSSFKTKVIDLGSDERLFFRTTSGGGYGIRDMMYLKEGEPYGQMLGIMTAGTWNTAEAEEAKAFGQLPGEIKYVDQNGDKKIDNKDLVPIGNALPDLLWGWNNRITYKDFSLSFLVQAVRGNDIFNLGRIRLERPGEGTSPALLNRWTETNQNTDVPAFIKQSDLLGIEQRISLDRNNPQRLSRWVEDGSYVRLKNVTLSYNLPASLTRKLGMSAFRAYVSGSNILTFTDYTGYDPEVSSYNANDARLGIDFGSYPQARTFTVGVDLTF